MTAKTRAARRSQWELQETRRRRLLVAFWVAVAVAFVAILVYLVWQQAQPVPRPGVDIPIQGRNHIAEGVPHDPYNSDPPTSGPHYATPAQSGFYDTAPADEYLVHSMEHGYVIIWYNCGKYRGGTCDQLKTQVKEVMGAAGLSTIFGDLKIIGTPRPSMPQVIALTGWGRLDKMDTFKRQEILDFIKAFRDNGPEALP
jgi:Protein of unknown function (DUF3105)